METNSADIGLIAATGALSPQTLSNIRVLGHGRAAEARLVRADFNKRQGSGGFDLSVQESAGAGSLLCVEKVFRPGLLTRLIYRAAFQAPFAYQDNADAILACFYRRRVAARIVRAMVPDARVAQPLYVRWDRSSGALVLASEYIRGRGITPAPVDRWKVRRRLASLLGRGDRIESPPTAEIDTLLDVMARLETLLVQCGLTGSGWQVCQRAMVSTANLLRTEEGYVVVDLESGIPSVLVPRYLLAGVRQGSLPMFDDLDPVQLRRWIDDNRSSLATALDERDLEQLDDDVQRLIGHSENWKRSEPAIGRGPWRLLSGDFAYRYRARVLASWRRREIVDESHAAGLSQSSRFLTTMTFLLGIIPGRVGRFFQRLWANAAYRQQVRRYLSDEPFRADATRRYVAAKSERWQASGRTGAERHHLLCDRRFAADWLLSKLTPTVLHRVIVDRQYRRDRLIRMFLLCVSGSFQSRFGRLRIQSRLAHWRGSVRLTQAQSDALHAQLDSPAVDEYVRCFGMHVGLKLLMPVVTSLKVGGAAASVASGNPLYFLFTLMLLPMLRTGVTLWRMMTSGRPSADYRDALLIGMLPVVGSLAYPVQMYAKFPALSLFLLRDFASRVGCVLPIYGGKDSRTEMAAIGLVDLLAEGLELWLAASVFSRRDTAGTTAMEPADDLPMSIKIRRWDRLASEQLERLSQETEAATCSLPPAGSRSTSESWSPARRAA